MIKKIEIALPSLSEQRRIVAYLDALQSKLDALKRHQAQTAASPAAAAGCAGAGLAGRALSRANRFVSRKLL